MSALLDPARASVRRDLGFLRHRARPRPEPVAAAPVIDLARPAAPVPDAAPALDLSRPSAAPALDLSRQSAAPALDLARPASPVAAPARHAPAPPTLDLARPSGVRTAPSAPGRTPLVPLLSGLRAVVPGERVVLDDDTPAVQLSRVQSGVGGLTLSLETALPANVAVLYELGGAQGLLRGPNPGFAPDHRRPVVSLTGTKLQLDLRQVRDLERFLVAVRGTRFDGVLVVRTTGGARLEVPLRLDTADGGTSSTGAPSGGTSSTAATVRHDLIALSAYRVRGALVLRAEDLVVTGGLREVADAFGYRDLTWRDPDTPLS